MNLLLSDIQWIHPNDPENRKVNSIRLEGGYIVEWGENLPQLEGETMISGNGACCSPGWCDIKVKAGAPGRPQNESIQSLAKAAAAGGFTSILISPDTQPIIQTIESVHYFNSIENENGVQFLVSAAASLQLEGKKMTEMLRLNEAGAKAYSFVNPVQDSGFLSQVLLYSQHANNPLIINPYDYFLTRGGQMNEGEVSDRRGLAGIPAVAEEVAIIRDLALLAYTGGKVHFSSVSLAGSAKKVKEKQREGHWVTCDVPALALAFSDEALDDFDTNFKVFPPLRNEAERLALVEAVRNGEIDMVVSDHSPWQYDFKECEFDLAEFGISSLETAYACLQTHVKGLAEERIVELLSLNPRKLLNLPDLKLQLGAPADFTLFHPNKKWTLTQNNWQSRSVNSPFFGFEFTGQVAGVVTQAGFFPNPHCI